MDDNMEDVDKHVKWLHSEHYSSAGDIFGEPQKTARVGDKYQAQIPSFMPENERFQLISLPVCHDVKSDDQNQFAFGLSIPVTWVHGQCKNKKKRKEIQAKGKSVIIGSGTHDGLVPVPCSSDEESWSVIERDSFLLGLYIFGKKLSVVNKFMGNKGMPHVLSYYYGKFYRSDEHHKWSLYRKKKSDGKKIFRGWRLKELLSRILPCVTDECKTQMTHIISTFKEGKLSFEKYVFTLRDIVGIDLLVESVAIGKVKRDITIKDTRPWKRNKKLQTEDVVNVLNDRTELSNARSSEVFWESVWPRLLARGWHSEQPTNYASKDSLVFLAPGVTKFSRRSLVKGIQYFDSLTEVLDKVASEPQLLEKEVEPCAKQVSKDEHSLVECTIVDTSVVGLVKVRKLTSLSDYEPVRMQFSSGVSEETEHDMTEESQKEDVNHNTVETHSVVDPVIPGIEDKKTDVSTDGQPVRKLKLVFKQKPKQQRISSTRNDDSSGEDKVMEYPRPKKKRTSIARDLSNPQVFKDRIGLSKPRLNEVFWESVWPRLLAKGWHTEQPTNYAGKHSLVFLAPGVAKFSRRSLVKGSQYFDSLTEVLDKVALEPQLVENEIKPEKQEGLEDQQDLVKYTIVDTSVVGIVKVRELTSLFDSEPAGMQASSGVSGETEQSMAEEYQMEDVNHNTQETRSGVAKFSRKGLKKGSRYFDSMTDVLSKVASEPQLLENKVKPRAKQGSKDQHSFITCTIVDTSVVGLVKVRELTSLSDSKPADMQASSSVSGKTKHDTKEEFQKEDVNQSVVELPVYETSNVNKDMANHLDPVITGNEDMKLDVSTNEQPVRKLKLVIKQKPKEHRVSNPSGIDETMEDPHPEKKRKSIVIDLNNPRVGPISDADNSLVSSKRSVSLETNTNQPEFSNHDASNDPRQSTRNRPLTVKAMESYACGFLESEKKRKGSEDTARRRVRVKTALVSSCGSPTLKIT